MKERPERERNRANNKRKPQRDKNIARPEKNKRKKENDSKRNRETVESNMQPGKETEKVRRKVNCQVEYRDNVV